MRKPFNNNQGLIKHSIISWRHRKNSVNIGFDFPGYNVHHILKHNPKIINTYE